MHVALTREQQVRNKILDLLCREEECDTVVIPMTLSQLTQAFGPTRRALVGPELQRLMGERVVVSETRRFNVNRKGVATSEATYYTIRA